MSIEGWCIKCIIIFWLVNLFAVFFESVRETVMFLSASQRLTYDFVYVTFRWNIRKNTWVEYWTYFYKVAPWHANISISLLTAIHAFLRGNACGDNIMHCNSTLQTRLRSNHCMLIIRRVVYRGYLASSVASEKYFFVQSSKMIVS